MGKPRTPIIKRPAIAGIPADYPALLSGIKQRIRAGQVRAALSANAELVALYWDIGRAIAQKQSQQGWGSRVIPRLARDLHNEMPELKGFSARNIDRMVAFFRAYPDPNPISPPPVAKSPPFEVLCSGQPLVSQLPWAHHVILMEKIKDLPTRLWYMRQTITNGWSRNTLASQIAGRAHLRQGQAVTNFADRLPPVQSDLATQVLKDPYIFDFLTLEAPFHERELETGLLDHVQKFLLELGQGFAFVGRQYHLSVGGDDFYIDLLFYHLHLRCFIVIDLKTGPFKPEYAGKVNFYCGVVDDHLRHPADQPTIGLILCQEKNRLVAEYALKGIAKAIGVSEYQLTRALPRRLQSSLPTIEQIEAELASAAPETHKPLRERRNRKS